MKKMGLIFALVSIMCVFAIAPVMAQPAQKSTIMAIQIPNAVQPPPNEDTKMFNTDGDIHHTFNAPAAGTLMLWIGSAPPAVPTYNAVTSSVSDVNLNLKTGEGDIKVNVIWDFGIGTFEGVLAGKMVGPPFTLGLQYYAIDYHGVLHGTEAFEGQTMMVDGIRAIGQPLTYTGTLLIP